MASRLGASLKSARERLGWSREALAHRSGLSWSAITQIESGRRREVRASTLVALANALGVSVDYLVAGEATVSPELLNHRLLVYGTDDAYVASTTPLIVEGIARGDAVLAVTTHQRAGLLRDALGASARQVDFLDSSLWYRSLPGAAIGYRDYVKQQFEHGSPWIRIIGEPVWSGQPATDLTEWFRYEALINLAFASSPVTVVCTYDTRSVPEAAIAIALRTHPSISVAGEISPSAVYQQPEEFLLTLT